MNYVSNISNITGNITQTIPAIVKEIGLELIQFAPKVIICVLIVLVAVLATRWLNRFIALLFEKTKVEEFIHKGIGFSIPLTRIVIALADLGIAIAVITGILHIVAPQIIPIFRQGLEYVARIVSVILLAFVTILGLNALVKMIKVEEKIKSFVLLMSFLLILVLLVDLAALSPEIKSALVHGISIGIGFAIGIFAIWFFFGEHIERKLKTSSKEECRE